MLRYLLIAARSGSQSNFANLESGQPSQSAFTMGLPRTASTVRSDWDYLDPLLQKMRETATEREAALGRTDTDALVEEMADLLLALVNLTRHIGI